MKPGEHTGKFGYWLDEYLQESSSTVQVYCDHRKATIENVGEIQGIYGHKAKSSNIFTYVDVMIANSNHEIKLLIEIEDKSVLVPKKIIGTVFSTAMCNRFAFGAGDKKRYFSTSPETQFIVAGYIDPKGKKLEQLKSVIQPRIMEFESLDDGIKLGNM